MNIIAQTLGALGNLTFVLSKKLRLNIFFKFNFNINLKNLSHNNIYICRNRQPAFWSSLHRKKIFVGW